MHNLALALHNKGFTVSGSDDEILEPSKSRLAKAGILPEKTGWFPAKITHALDAVILGMHARADNPELLEAQKKGIRIYSYPDYLYEFSKNKLRVVIGGSHGKTSITAMVLHVMNSCGLDFDFMVGAQLDGFDTMVRLTDSAPVIVLEGDEYLASPVDRRPKFHLYHPHIALLSGIAWDHINVFPDFDFYVEQFRIFIDLIEKNGTLIYCINDEWVKRLAAETRNQIEKIPYSVPDNEINNGTTSLLLPRKEKIPLKIFGNHNLMNLEGARLVCNKLGITDYGFYDTIQSFKGAAKRLEVVAHNNTTAIYKDFAHSPSKLKATVEAVKLQYSSRRIIACMELHTFSSLNEDFLLQYSNSLNEADTAIVYFNPHTIEHKKLKPITAEQVKKAFNRNDLHIYTNTSDLKKFLLGQEFTNAVLLMMSSGNFDGMDFNLLAQSILK